MIAMAWVRKYKFRVGIGVITAVFFVASGVALHIQRVKADALQQATTAREAALASVLPSYTNLNKKIKSNKDAGLDVTESLKSRDAIRQLVLDNKTDEATTQITAAIAVLDSQVADKATTDQQKAADEAAKKAAEAAKLQSEVKGKITEGSNGLSGAAASLSDGKNTLTSATSDKDGNYSIHYTAGKYTLVVSKSGYVTSKTSNITLTAQQTTTQDISLTKATPKPAAPTTSSSSSSASASTNSSHYERKDVSTSRGTFTVDVVTVDLTKGRVITDTAADGDCSDNCPTKSLQSYVSSNGGFAGINGTYFCPTDYAACAGKTNTFYWKVYASRLKKIINENNGGGEDDPAYIFTSDNKAHYFSYWKDAKNSGLSMVAGINSRPALVNHGDVVLDTNSLDDKQRSVKSNRGALGQNGNTFYAVVAKSATVIDLSEIMHSLGVTSAINIDGGGSSAIYYNGGYKVGPGRALPNAVILAE